MPKSSIFVQSYLPVAAGPDSGPVRRARAKQVLALDGERSMIQQTVERLKPLAAGENMGDHQRVPGTRDRRPA